MSHMTLAQKHVKVKFSSICRLGENGYGESKAGITFDLGLTMGEGALYYGAQVTHVIKRQICNTDF